MELIIQNKTINIQSWEGKGKAIAEIQYDDVLLSETQLAVELLVDLYYQGFDVIILYEKNINPLFFDLSSGMAGEILQKITNYRIGLAIVGDFTNYSKSLHDFILESNKRGNIIFVASLEEAKKGLGVL